MRRMKRLLAVLLSLALTATMTDGMGLTAYAQNFNVTEEAVTEEAVTEEVVTDDTVITESTDDDETTDVEEKNGTVEEHVDT